VDKNVLSGAPVPVALHLNFHDRFAELLKFLATFPPSAGGNAKIPTNCSDLSARKSQCIAGVLSIENSVNYSFPKMERMRIKVRPHCKACESQPK
jgi:hypothetical protein